MRKTEGVCVEYDNYDNCDNLHYQTAFVDIVLKYEKIKPHWQFSNLVCKKFCFLAKKMTKRVCIQGHDGGIITSR